MKPRRSDPLGQVTVIHVVGQGDCMSSIGSKYGHDWEKIWNLGDNAALKALRKNPNVLMEGDQITIPDKVIKLQSRASGSQHKFIRKGVPETLRVQLLDAKKAPRANLAYTLIVDGVYKTGMTNGQGEVNESISPDAQSAKLVLGKDGKEIMNLNLGHLDPISEISGIKGRLANLGFYNGVIDGNLDDVTQAAISAFQTAHSLLATGSVDDATQSKLLSMHGH